MPRRAKAQPTTIGDLVPALSLPGESSLDEGLVENAARYLSHLAMTTSLETARTTGEYVLATFFDGRPENFRARGNQHLSFKALAERKDLGMSSSFLWRAVSFVEQLRLLPANLATSLPYSHQLALLPLKDEDAKKELAQRTIDEGWTRNDLEGEVKKVREQDKSGSKAGRPELPAFVKTIHKWQRTLEEPEAALGGMEELEGLKVEEVRRLWETMVAMRERCVELEGMLRGRMGV